MSEETTTETTPAATTAPAPAPPAPKATPAPTPTHAGPDRVPVARLNAVIAERDAARVEAARVATIEAELTAARAEATRYKIRGERDLVYAGMSDRPNLAAPEVRDFVEGQFSSYAERTGADHKPFGEWLSEVAPTSPLLAPHLAPATPAAPATPGAPPPKVPPVDVNLGATGSAGAATPSRLTRDQIRQKKSAGTWTQADADANLASLEADGIITRSPTRRRR